MYYSIRHKKIVKIDIHAIDDIPRKLQAIMKLSILNPSFPFQQKGRD